MSIMSRYFGYNPKGAVKSAVESFEASTQVQGAGGMLLGTVYVDISEERWAVAMAYGRAHHPKLRGPEPVYEVRYSYRPVDDGEVKRLDTREAEDCSFSAGPFPSTDEFILWALNEERERLIGSAN
jgi:hypothetical protein